MQGLADQVQGWIAQAQHSFDQARDLVEQLWKQGRLTGRISDWAVQVKDYSRAALERMSAHQQSPGPGLKARARLLVEMD